MRVQLADGPVLCPALTQPGLRRQTEAIMEQWAVTNSCEGRQAAYHYVTRHDGLNAFYCVCPVHGPTDRSAAQCECLTLRRIASPPPLHPAPQRAAPSLTSARAPQFGQCERGGPVVRCSFGAHLA